MSDDDSGAATQQVKAWRRLRRALDEFHLPGTLLDFVLKVYGPEALDEAWAEFSDLEEPFDFDTPHITVFMPWMFHRWSADPRGVPTRLFLKRRGRRLDPLVRSYLEGCLEAPFGFHEILRCDPGRGFRTRELFTGEEAEVMEEMASGGLRRGDILFGQLVTAEGVTILEASAPCALPPLSKIELIDFRRQLLESPDPELELLWCYFDLIEDALDPPLPQLQNTDGEPIEMHRLVFEIDSAQVAFTALRDLDFDRTEEELLASARHTRSGELKRVQLAWKKPGNRQHKSWTNTILGHLEIKERQLIAEVNSAQRARQFKGLVEERLGDRARLRSDRIQSLEKALAKSKGSAVAAAEQAALAQLPELQAYVQQLMSAHFEAWVSEPIPALGGRTPLDAIRDPEGREKVLALVVDAERHARSMTPAINEVVFERVRERLGLGQE